MQDTIKVHVVRYPGRPSLYMRYVDPSTGKQVARSSKTASLRDAEKAAAKWEAELQEGRYARPSRLTWEAFRVYYTTHATGGLAPKTVDGYETTLNAFERICRPAKLVDVTTQRVTAFVTQLRSDGLVEASIARNLRQLKAAMRWANREGLLPTVPQFTMPKRVKGAKVMRGRAITLEEFERMLSATAKVVENAAAESWTFYLRGLWASGLRLAESLTLRWDFAPDCIVVDFSGRRPMLRIPAEAEEAHTDRLLPITPEFATLLQSVPERNRRGRVFKLLANDGSLLRDDPGAVGKVVSAIGESAGVIVDEKTRKFASAHDLRRAFGQRWAAKVMPTVLRELMRHASIATTMAYYAGTNAEATADALWEAEGKRQGNSDATAQPEVSENRLFKAK